MQRGPCFVSMQMLPAEQSTVSQVLPGGGSGMPTGPPASADDGPSPASKQSAGIARLMRIVLVLRMSMSFELS